MAKIDVNDLDDAQVAALVASSPDLPCDPDSERAVLASMISDQSAADAAAYSLQAEDFYSPPNRMLFELLLGMMKKTLDPLDFVTVSGEAKRKGLVFDLDDLMRERYKSKNVDGYVRRVVESSLRRRLIDNAGETIEKLGKGGDTDIVLGQALAVAEDVQRRRMHIRDEPQDVKLLARDIGHHAINSPSLDVVGMRTGLAEGKFDDLTGGIRPGYWIVTGLSGKGKSWLCSCITVGLMQHNKDVGAPLLVSTELSKKATATRILAISAGVSVGRLIHRNLHPDDKAKIERALGPEGIPNGITATFMGGKDVEAVIAIARQHKRKHGLPLLVVDMPSRLRYGDKDGVDMLSSISNRLQAAADELETCIIGVVQQNKMSYGKDFRGGDDQIGGNMKGTGSWLEDCDMGVGIFWEGKAGQEHTAIRLVKDRELGNAGRSIKVQWNDTGTYKPAGGA